MFFSIRYTELRIPLAEFSTVFFLTTATSLDPAAVVPI